jgi:hypothetical protein
VRLSRTRLALRVVLLSAGGLWLVWRALGAYRAAGALEPGGALLGSRMALVLGLMGVLALLAAASGALALRRRPPRQTLHLGHLPPGRPGQASAQHPPRNPQ